MVDGMTKAVLECDEEQWILSRAPRGCSCVLIFVQCRQHKVSSKCGVWKLESVKYGENMFRVSVYCISFQQPRLYASVSVATVSKKA